MEPTSLLRNRLRGEALPPLFPTQCWRPEITAAIDALPITPLERAGWHLANDDIERCHAIAQVEENPLGNYWHAILHRREKDFSNSRYWLKRSDTDVVTAAMRTQYPDWDPVQFTYECEKAESAALRKLQAAEILCLIEGTSQEVPSPRGA